MKQADQLADAKQASEGLANNLGTNRYRFLPSRQRGSEQSQSLARRAAAAPAEPTKEPSAESSTESVRPAPFGAVASETRRLGRYAAENVLTVAAGKPIEFELPADLANRKLLAAAMCDGVVVASEQIVPAAKRSSGTQTPAAAQSVRLNLPPEANGEMIVRFYDPTQQPPVQLGEQAIYREPQQKWNVAISGQKPAYAPGESVRLTFKVTNEAGQPEPAALAVRVWNEQLAGESPQGEQQLAQQVLQNDAWLATSNYFYRQSPTQPAGQAQPGNRLADEGARVGSDVRDLAEYTGDARMDRGEMKEVAPQVDAHFFQATVEQRVAELDFDTSLPAVAPTLLADNRAAVTALYESAWTQAAEARQTRRETLGRLSLLAGLGVLLLLAIQGLLRLRAEWKVLLPTVALAAASLALGVLWINPQPTAVDQLASNTATPAADERELASAGASQQNADAPAAKESASTLAEKAPTNSLSFREPEETESLDRNANVADPTPQNRAAAVPAAAPAFAPAPAPAAASDAAAMPADAAREAKLKSKAQGEAAAATNPISGGEVARKNALAEKRLAPASPPSVMRATGKAPSIAPSAAPEAAGAPALQLADMKREADTKGPAADKAANRPSVTKPGEEETEKGFAASGGAKKGKSSGALEQPLPSDSPAAAPKSMLRRSTSRQLSDELAKQELAKKNDSLATTASAAKAPTTKAPASLYWNPQLTADAQGRAVIEFTMPAVESNYRILIDAYGNGRLGSAQEVVLCREQPE
jgi:hypothetical protein